MYVGCSFRPPQGISISGAAHTCVLGGSSWRAVVLLTKVLLLCSQHSLSHAHPDALTHSRGNPQPCACATTSGTCMPVLIS